MCGIVIAYNVTEFNRLMALNEYRGSLAYSYTFVQKDGLRGPFRIATRFRPIKQEEKGPSDLLIIGHQQAPTGNTKLSVDIHPAENDAGLLWHNGLIRDEYLSKVTKENWDTRFLLNGLTLLGAPFLDTVEGSFACVWYSKIDKKIRFFRNQFVPLFAQWDEAGASLDSLSSTKQNAVVTEIYPNEVLELDPETGNVEKVFQIDNTDNPYFFLQDYNKDNK